MTLLYLPGATDDRAALEPMLITMSHEAAKRPDALTKRFARDLSMVG